MFACPHLCISPASSPLISRCTTALEVRAGETRKLIGTYLRWDEIRSMARVKAAATFPEKLL